MTGETIVEIPLGRLTALIKVRVQAELLLAEIKDDGPIEPVVVDTLTAELNNVKEWEKA